MTDTTADPVTGFAHCHTGLVRRLRALGELPELLAPAARARALADSSVAFFREAIVEHHLDEERELFPAVLASATPGDEQQRVQALVDRLTQQHRLLEAQWKALEKDLRRIAKGQESDLDGADLLRLVGEYQAHATYEETEFLPLAQAILGRNAHHLDALGLSLHLRHVPQPAPYI